jgi:hypothetical protein
MLHDSSQPNKYTGKYYLRGSVSAFYHRKYSKLAAPRFSKIAHLSALQIFMAPIKPVCGFV